MRRLYESMAQMYDKSCVRQSVSWDFLPFRPPGGGEGGGRGRASREVITGVTLVALVTFITPVTPLTLTTGKNATISCPLGLAGEFSDVLAVGVHAEQGGGEDE